MAKALTMPTAPEAPIAPQVSIGERIHGIENRIQEIEDISGMNGVSKSRNNNRQSQSEEAEESQDEQQVQSDQPARSQRQNQSQQKAQPSSRKVETPETMARDAVANGSGALTKRTTQRGNDERSQDNDGGGSQARNQSTVVIPPASALSNDDGRTSFEKGRAVLDEFKQLDREEAAKQSSSGLTSSTESPGIFAPTHNIGSQHGIGYWLFTLIAIGVLAFVFVKHFLIGKNSKQSAELREAIESTNSLALKQTAIKEYSQSSKQPVKPSTPKPATTSNILRAKSSMPSPTPPPKIATLKSQPPKEDEKKGKHFEVRV
ncbi:MAG: hypothetical protein IJ728_05555 [Selenomonadaceae bacterium]|nr:hypothetical protein [Selenomonadaceae bacterium]